MNKFSNRSRGRPEGSIFNSYYTMAWGRWATPFPGLLHFTLDTYFIMLSVKQGGIKFHFLSLWYDSTWDWTLVSQAIGEHSTTRPIAWLVQSHVESYQRLKKWYLIPPCLILSIIRLGSRVKWNNPGNGVAPSPTPRCSSYWKGSLRSSTLLISNYMVLSNNYYLIVICLPLYDYMITVNNDNFKWLFLIQNLHTVIYWLVGYFA